MLFIEICDFYIFINNIIDSMHIILKLSHNIFPINENYIISFQLAYCKNNSLFFSIISLLLSNISFNSRKFNFGEIL